MPHDLVDVIPTLLARPSRAVLSLTREWAGERRDATRRERAWRAATIHEMAFDHSGYALGNYVDAQQAIHGVGFLVFVVGQALILASAAMDLAASGPMFGAGAGLWAASLFLLSASKVAAIWVRIVGAIAGALFLFVAIRLFMGQALTPLSAPLPSFAYPFLVATLVGWAWERYRSAI